MKDKLRLALLISGGASTANEIIRACISGRLSRVTPVCVIADREGAGVKIEKLPDNAQKIVLDPRKFSTREAWGDAIIATCRQYNVDVIGQYGWLPKTPGNVIEAYSGKMINQHPGLLDPGYPDFGGKGMFGRRVHAAVLFFRRAVGDMNAMWTEATAQRVAAEYDRGAVLLREKVEILPDDDPISLQQRVLPIEHLVQIQALRMIADGSAATQKRSERLVPAEQVAVLEAAKRAAGLLFPKG